MKKRRIVLIAAIAILAFGIAFPFMWAAHQIRGYLRIVYPHFLPHAQLLATYNPVDGAFNMRITDCGSDDSIFLECVSNGLIIDEMRTGRYLEEHGIPTYFTADDESVGYLQCYWKYDSPSQPRFVLRILGGDYIPATDEVKLEKALKARMLTHYDQLPDIVRAHLLRCHIGRRTASTSYRLIVNTTAKDDFTALLDQTEVRKEALK